ncbi:M16 family metallopeptidase [Taibaiella helva]|uniref:M16 family metallopeptidase n=1 Tax=Taibaiella helva TaxID=2301235 RepID=UPI000E58E968|nr:pitrilysin family protein [Taibaiella helva]
MKRFFLSAVLFAGGAFSVSAQEGNIKFTEYDLPNGLHVILHEDHAVPIVSVSVMYHVGSKNEDPSRTGFAHFFEHLLFEGTDNIQRGEYMKLVQNNGGVLNANTSQDRTYYFEELPANQLELGLWMEAERMLHAKIDSTGIETQRKVVKEEKKMRYDNSPYGMWQSLIFENAFTKHPYRWTPIGKEQYIDQAKASEFMDFYKTFYVPNNAVLVLAGDFKPEQAKEWINKYYGDIPRGTGEVPRPNVAEPAQTKEKRVKYNANVQLPMVVLAYHAPKMGTDDMYALELLNQLLSQGASSRLQKQVVDKDQKAVQVGAFNTPLEDPGLMITLGIAARGVTAAELEKAMKNEIEKVRDNLISEEEFKKLQNQAENSFVSQNGRIAGIAESLATNYTYFHDTNLINTELARYQKITREDLKRVADKYLTKDNCVVLYYVPKGQ